MAPGSSIAHYRVIAKLGQGGMGEVWRATDTKLGREVAIKILPEALAHDVDRMARFAREARVLASLNHPNIAAIYGVEENALVMELVEGPTLAERISAGPISVEEVVCIAKQIGEALEHAHAHGIIHRDLKPANIKLGARVKVLDFGLAKMPSPAQSEATITAATHAGAVLGTVAYMSPEQAASQPADSRSDVFSYGLVLYEMLSGRRAFSEKTPISTLAAILHAQPRPLRELVPSLPVALDAIVARCLAKDPSARFPSMNLLLRALENLSQPVAAPRGTSIAVLPFTNLSAEKENEYFSDGLAEEILNALSQVEGLQVAARSSSFSFKSSAVEISEIAAKLRVANILEGSVRRAGDRVRVTVQLVDVNSGFHLWSERYDRQMKDIFDVQDEIARAIAERFKVTLCGGAQRTTQNLEAYELYLKGRHYWHQRLPATVRLAIECFERAINLDPQYALAYAGLADCYGILRVYGWISTADARPPAHAAITQAVTLAPSLWEVTFSRGFYTFYFERGWREADAYFQKAITINPRSSLCRAYYGIFLATEGRAEDSLSQTTQACQFDPLSPLIHGLTSLSLFTLARFEEAERMARHALELQPGYLLGLWAYSLALCGLERNEEAIDALERAVAMSRAPIFVGALGFACARAGRPDDAIRLLNELEDRSERGEYVPAFALLAIYLGQGVTWRGYDGCFRRHQRKARCHFRSAPPPAPSWRRIVMIPRSMGSSSTCTASELVLL
jgi:serine/threonine protein kinase/Tfp pilus assembly protein PilF